MNNILRRNNIKLLTQTDLEQFGAELQEKLESVEQFEAEFTEKSAALLETTSALTDNQTLLKESAEKVSQIKDVDGIETGKTLIGARTTVARDDYNKIIDLAKKQIASENREGELTAEVTKLKKENKVLSSENTTLRENVRAARSLQSSFSALQRELDSWKQRYKKVIEFIENLGLIDKLERKILAPGYASHERTVTYRHKSLF